MRQPANPFVGLRPFQTDESHLFFGRRGQIRDVLLKLQQHRLLAVVGRSGCGKSSLVRAGLIPALAAGFLVDDREHWRICVTQPGSSPLRNLATALWVSDATQEQSSDELTGHVDQLTKRLQTAGARAVFEHLSRMPDGNHRRVLGDDENLLILVDQFEELFRFGLRASDDAMRDEAARFVAILLALAERRSAPVYVVITMRSDYLRDCDAFYGLPEAINRCLYLVPRLTREMRREIVEGPVSLFNASIAPKLVERLLDESDDECRFDGTDEEPDQLPVLQHALMRTWEHWREAVKRDGGSETSSDPLRPIDDTDYEAVGTLKCALSNDANSALRHGDEELTKRVFQALTETDMKKRRIRRAATTSEIMAEVGLTDIQRLWDIIDPFRSNGRTFVVMYTADRTGRLHRDARIDISHESLIRRWDKLSAWVEAESDSADTYRWIAGEADKAAAGPWPLLRDRALEQAETWWGRQRPNAAWAARYCPTVDYHDVEQFLERSRAERDRIAAEQQRRQQAEERRQQEHARHQEELAQAREAELVKTRELALVQRRRLRVARQFSAAILMFAAVAVVSYGRANTARNQQQADRTYFSLVASARDQLPAQPQHALLLAVQALHQRDRSLSDLRAENLVLEGLMRTGGQGLAGHSKEVRTVAVTSNGKWLLTASADGTVLRWDLHASDPERHVQSIHRDQGSAVVDAVLSPDDKWIALGTNTGEVSLRSVKDFAGASDCPLSSNPNSKTMKCTLHVGASITALAVSGNGRFLVAGLESGDARFWNVGTADAMALRPPGNTSPISLLNYSVDGRWLLIGSDEAASLWHVAEGSTPRLIEWARDPIPITAVEMNARNGSLFTGRADGVVDRWTLTGDGRITPAAPLMQKARAVSALASSRDGKWLATGSTDGTVRIWDLNAGSLRNEYAAADAGEVRIAKISADSRWLVAVNRDGLVRLWDLPTVPLRTTKLRDPRPDARSKRCAAPAFLSLRGHEGFVGDAVFSADGHWLVTAGADGTARLWNLRAADPTDITVRHRGHHLDIQALTISPDLHWLVTGSPHGIERFDLNEARSQEMRWDALEDATFYATRLTADNRWLVTLTTREHDRRLSRHEWALTLYENAATGLRKVATRDRVSTVEFSADSTLMVIGSGDGTTSLWRLDSRDLMERTVLHASQASGAVLAAAIDARKQHVAVTTADGIVRVWNVTTNPAREMLKESIGKNSISSLALSSNGRWLAVGRRQPDAALVWDLEARESRHQEITGHRNPLTTLSISPDSDLLVTASEDGTARVYCFRNLFDLRRDSTAHGDKRCEQGGKKFDAWLVFDRHRGPVTTVRISPDSRRLLTIDREGVGRVWSLVSPSPQHLILQSRNLPIVDAVFSRDGDVIMTASGDGTVRNVPLEGKSLERTARRTIGRNLSPNEWCEAVSAVTYRRTFDDLPVWKERETDKCADPRLSWSARILTWFSLGEQAAQASSH
jgi:WD40 repeat protein